jgi:hypothetical protein
MAVDVANTDVLRAQALTETARAADIRQNTLFNAARTSIQEAELKRAQRRAEVYGGDYGRWLTYLNETGRAIQPFLPFAGGLAAGAGVRALRGTMRNPGSPLRRPPAPRQPSTLVDQYGRPFRRD